MVYLSKIELKPSLDLKILASAIPKNAYAEHQAIWRLIGGENGQARHFLYRREQDGHWPVFYVLSAQELEVSDGPWDIRTKPFAPKLANGQRLGFVLRANPVRTVRASPDSGDKRRVRHDVIMHAKRQDQAREADSSRRRTQAELVQQVGPAWLNERAERAGFQLETVHADAYRQHRLSKRSQGKPIQFSTLDYQGVLCVLDPERLIQTLHHGLGHAKAFGCGLLLVRRL